MAEIKFEEGYLFRNNRAITSSPDIALTELVANAWDAGALKVDITLPYEDSKQISIKDNGCGMTEEEFDAFLQYHLATCERMDLMGASGHTVDILVKEESENV